MIKKVGKHRVNFYLENNQILDLKQLSQKLCISIGAIIRLAVGEFLAKNKDK